MSYKYPVGRSIVEKMESAFSVTRLNTKPLVYLLNEKNGILAIQIWILPNRETRKSIKCIDSKSIRSFTLVAFSSSFATIVKFFLIQLVSTFSSNKELRVYDRTSYKRISQHLQKLLSLLNATIQWCVLHPFF